MLFTGAFPGWGWGVLPIKRRVHLSELAYDRLICFAISVGSMWFLWANKGVEQVPHWSDREAGTFYTVK